MLNRVCLCGRLIKDVDLKRTETGKAVGRFTLAVNRNFKTNDGQEADFINIVCFGKVAENTAQYCGKGSLVSIDGRLQTGSYEKDGQKVYFTSVIADNVTFLETKRSNGQGAQRQAQTTTSPNTNRTIKEPTVNEFVPNNSLDDIQF